MASANKQLVIPEAAPFEKPPENGSFALMRIIEKAVLDPQFDAAKLAVLLDVKLRWEADEARKHFEEAFQQFKRNLPEIFKTRHVQFPTKSGDQTDYWHAELDKITPIITEALLAVGIVHSWRCSDANGKTTVTCVLEGFNHTREAATLSGPADTSGGKNSIQAIGSTKTYLERYTLLAACGIAAKGTDDDGKTEGMEENAITDYCIQMQDAPLLSELQAVFKECYTKAKIANDREAQGRFVKVYEENKRRLKGTQ
jgi:hypothetical protein